MIVANCLLAVKKEVEEEVVKESVVISVEFNTAVRDLGHYPVENSAPNNKFTALK